jgi:IclR family mhp operon transcriptional activator
MDRLARRADRPAIEVPSIAPRPSARQPIAKALDLLRAMNRHPYASLHTLHRDTGFPKPTVHRLLESLIAEGYVVRDEVKSIYRLTAKVRELSGGFGEDCLVTDVGAEILRRVTAEIQWPLAIGTLQGVEILVRYSTMPFSPLAVKPTTTANRHSLLASAMGNTYLAYCPPAERAFLIEALRRSSRADAALAADARAIQALVDEVVARGFGVRQPRQRSDSGSLAVPIFADRHLAGVLSLTGFGRMLPDILTRYPPLLAETAREISERLALATTPQPSA